jgi:hypothetical protein
MTKMLKFKIILWSLLWSNIALQAQNIEKERKISKSYNVNSATTLSLNNKYGKIEVQGGQSAQIQVEISILSYAISEQRAQELVNNVKINIQEGNNISFTTEENYIMMKSSKLKVNYLVKMPKTVPLNIQNKFGDVVITEHQANLNVDVGYGTLDIGKASGSSTKNIKVAYGKANIGWIEQGKLDIAYSNLDIEKAGKIDLNHRYSKSIIQTVEHLNLDNKYSKLELNTVGSLKGNSAYSSTFSIGNLQSEFVLQSKYDGKIEIQNIAKGFKLIEINGSYSSADLYFDNTHSFGFQIDLRYGNFNTEGLLLQFATKIIEGQSKSYSGNFGSKVGTSKIKVNLSYGSLKFK